MLDRLHDRFHQVFQLEEHTLHIVSAINVRDTTSSTTHQSLSTWLQSFREAHHEGLGHLLDLAHPIQGHPTRHYLDNPVHLRMGYLGPICCRPQCPYRVRQSFYRNLTADDVQYGPGSIFVTNT